MEKIKKQEHNLHFAFIDFRMAFDCANRYLLFSILERLGRPAKLSQEIKKIYTNVYARRLIQGEMSEYINYNSSVKQG